MKRIKRWLLMTGFVLVIVAGSLSLVAAGEDPCDTRNPDGSDCPCSGPPRDCFCPIIVE